MPLRTWLGWVVGYGVVALGCASSIQGPGRARIVPDFAYALEWVRAPLPTLLVELSFTADRESTVLACTPWGGIEACEDEIHGLAARGPRGALAVEHVSSNTWALGTRKGEAVVVTYGVVSSRYDPAASFGTVHHPIVNERYLQFVGDLALVAPKEHGSKHSAQVAVHWSGLQKDDAVGSILGVDADVYGLVDLDDFRHSVFLAGDFRLSRGESSSGGEITLASRPGGWGFRDEALLATILPVVDAERKLFGGPPQPRLLLSVIPTDAPPEGDAFSADGTSLFDSIAFFLPPQTSLDGKRRLAIALLAAHEYFHRWNGMLIHPSDKEDEGGAWYAEGFTEFYMRRMALRAKQISAAEYATYFNRALFGLVLSPARHATNEEIQGSFWKSMDIQRLPYLRGQVVALLVDARMRRNSGGARSLDDSMRNLAAEARRRPHEETTASILETIGAATSKEFEAMIRGIVIDGRSPDLPADALAPCATIKERQIEYDVGFDLDRSTMRGELSGVRVDSEAFRAGLRDGQELVDWNRLPHPDQRDAWVIINESGRRRTVRYEARGHAISAPQIEVSGGEMDCGRVL